MAEEQFESKAIPPTYAPPRPPLTGKPLTKRQKVALAATILAAIVIATLLLLLIGHLF